MRQKLRDAEDRAYDRFLSARAVLAEALGSTPSEQGASLEDQLREETPVEVDLAGIAVDRACAGP